MKRERIDKSMSREVLNRVIIPVVQDFGAKHLVTPFLGRYDHENKTLTWGLGYKKHGDKRHRTAAKFEGIHYADGEQIEGDTTTVEIDHRIGMVAQARQPQGGEPRHGLRKNHVVRGDIQQTADAHVARHREQLQRQRRRARSLASADP